jgi:protein-tyrosine phosphatase
VPRVGFFGKSDAVEIMPGFYIGSAPDRRTSGGLARAGVSHVIDLRTDAGQATSRWPEGVTVWPSALVEYQAPSVDTLRDIARQVAELLTSGATVFVHCREGIQRAPMVACAVLMDTGWSLSDAYRLVSDRRPVTAMTEAQLWVLRELEAAQNGHLAQKTAAIG